jgi:murein DD-endopeptidase MepM/ murein hydrolase activator NlpD
LDSAAYAAPFSANFAAYGRDKLGIEYHAAEDSLQPAGTPVYAMADGTVSFSGPMGGYGWLVIIDHPQANLYSLYGHLSPSRWRIASGTVEKGEPIGYLGDPDENGGSAKRPLRTHLHFGIRAGQRADYPGTGEWRWQAGWIRPCPQDLGWLQPSTVITGQQIPVDGFPEPASGFAAKWGIELFFAGIYLFSGINMFIFAIRKEKPLVLVFCGVVMLAAGWYFANAKWRMSPLLFVMAALLLATGAYRSVRRSTKPQSARSQLAG